MKIFIPSYNRASSIRTHKLFPEAVVVVHNEQQRDEYRKHNPDMNIVVSNVKADAYGLTRQREFICYHLAEKSSWFIFADDNIRSLICVVPEFYDEPKLPVTMADGALWRPRFNVVCSPHRFMKVIVPDTMKYCINNGAHLAGFAVTDNIIFRREKFSKAAYVIGKLMIWHNTREIAFRHDISMEDFYHTCAHLTHYGVCVVNKYLFPRATHYQPGGMGTYDERLPVRKRDVKILLKMFPGLLQVHNHPGFEPNTDLKLIHTAAAALGRYRGRVKLV